MSYQPNFNDPRVVARCRQALGFACAVMSETKSRSWSTRYIDEHFGQSTTDISKWLRKTLLICTDEFCRFNIPGKQGICKKYVLNKSGASYLREALKIDNIQLYPIVYDLAHAQHAEELSTGNFTYNDKSNRLWHPLQRYRRQYRTQILADAGYAHDYDIECCAPTLIHQYAQQCGMDLYLFALCRYLADRTAIRDELALALELEPAAVKEIINALFAGAVISKNSNTDIYDILNGDLARIEYLKQDPFITELVSDIRTCWDYIKPYMSRRTKTQSNGKQRLIPLTCKNKWHVYFELERVVINSVRTYLDMKSIRYFLIHDGWTCDREIDRKELENYVRDQTGYEIKFEYTKN
jgi:hypothetical protein